MFDISKTRAVLWDLDDTLYSRRDAARLTFSGMFKKHLYPDRNDEFIKKAVDYMMTQVKRNSMIHEDAFNALLEKYPSDKPYVRSDCLNYYYENLSRFVTPFPEQISVIKELRRQGIKNAIVTNIATDRLDSQKKKLAALNISHLFDAVVFSGELGIHKPDRRIFDHTAAILGLDNNQCVFVGDDPESDVIGAKTAEMDVVWIDRYEYDGRFNDDPRVHRVNSVLEYFKFNTQNVNMNKVAVIGSPGAGKTTFSRKLQSITGLPLYHLDLIWHKPDKTNIPREEFDEKLKEIMSKDRWIIDGNYSRTVEARIKECDTVFLLDIPLEVCLKGAESRIGKKRSDLPWLEEKFDPEFRQWIIDFQKDTLPNLYGLLNKYTGKNVIVFKSHREADDYLSDLSVIANKEKTL